MAKPNILVVDDEAVVRESLRDWFSEQGYPVDIAASAREALLKLTEARWDILVTDIKMPGMDGLELQARVKKIDPEMAIVIMTAYASIETANQAIREGAYDYVTKPLDPDDLEQIVNRAAERQQLIRENLQLRERIDSVSGETDEIIGESPEIEKVRELIQSAASSTDPVPDTKRTPFPMPPISAKGSSSSQTAERSSSMRLETSTRRLRASCRACWKRGPSPVWEAASAFPWTSWSFLQVTATSRRRSSRAVSEETSTGGSISFPSTSPPFGNAGRTFRSSLITSFGNRSRSRALRAFQPQP
jgi:CheY-like chemotaxis protein